MSFCVDVRFVWNREMLRNGCKFLPGNLGMEVRLLERIFRYQNEIFDDSK